MRVVATAGHVDHGKSTLVHALSGIDPDRLPEEKSRGLTIDLGFANTTLPSGEEVAFVDVPGHARFVGNMLAGVGGVDGCLFVVDATEGWKEQTEEHLRILELVGVSHGVVAMTKVGAAEEGWSDLVRVEVRDRLAGTFLEEADIVAVDAPAGIGVGDLVDALERLVKQTPPAPDTGRPRMWVDRSFTVQGAGTVVTGTLRDGAVEQGDELAVEPGGLTARVRGLQSHNRSLARAEPGRRLALNLAGIGRREVGRGQALVRPSQWHRSKCFDARLTVLPSLRHAVERRGAYSVYIGSGEFPVRLRLLGENRIEPGAEGYARFWLRSTDGVPLLPGDRYVLREAGRFETVGGGEILDVEPVLPASRARPSRSVDRVIRERGWVDAGHLERITGEARDPTAGRWVVDPGTLESDTAALRERIRDAGRKGLETASLGERLRDLLATIEDVVVEDGYAREGGRSTAPLSQDANRVLRELESGGFSPPLLPLTDRGSLRELQKAGLAVEAEGVWFASSALDRAVEALAKMLDERPQGFTVAEARDTLGSSRKHVLPLLGHLDSTGVTRRRGDLRVAGPRFDDAVRGSTGRGRP